MTELIQKTWFNKKEVTIEYDRLLIKSKNIREDLEYKIKFEELGFETVKKRIKTANIPFYAFLVFDSLYVGLIVNSIANKEPYTQQIFWVFALIVFSIITIVAYCNRNKNIIYLTGGQKVLELLAEKPDEKTVRMFIETIHKSIRVFYKNKYSKFDADTPLDIKVNQLKWLKEIKALTVIEYEELLDKTKLDTIIGFNRPNLES